ncbi:hypothetical protein J4210_04265 [Candidatus Woesearchaeota archaeon]|nr:hypothetical protein [Candidatus Woesearchaeota archaeon]
MPITNTDRPKVNVSVNEVRRQEVRPENSFRFAEPVQPEQKRENRSEEPERRAEAREPRAPREIQVSIRPWKVLKLFLILLVFSSVFFAGRWSADGTDIFSFSSPGPTAAAVSEKAVEKETVPAATVKSAVDEAALPAEEGKVEAPASDVPEKVITKYSKVALAVTAVKKEWYDGWGKIVQLSVTIKNNEEGTIKPAYLVMNVEGYDDFDKRVPLPGKAQEIKAGVKLEENVNIPNGFAYNPATKGIGDMGTVHIITRLYDERDVLITTFGTDYDLRG